MVELSEASQNHLVGRYLPPNINKDYILAVTPSEPFPCSSVVKVAVTSNIPSLEGPLLGGNGFTVEANVAPEFQVLGKQNKGLKLIGKRVLYRQIDLSLVLIAILCILTLEITWTTW